MKFRGCGIPALQTCIDFTAKRNPGNQFPLLRDAHKHPFPMLRASPIVHVAFVPQALGFQGPSLGLWLADLGRELRKFQDWRPPILFCGVSFFCRGGRGA